MRDSEKPIPGCQLVHVALRFTEGEPGAMEGRVLGRRTSFFDKLHDRGTRSYGTLKSPVLRLLEDVGRRLKVLFELSFDCVWNPRLIIECRTHGVMVCPRR
jgi:hypothetical protein